MSVGKRYQEYSRPGAKARFDRMAVANEILRQLGGGRFMAMVGGKNALATTVNGKNGLQVQIGRGAKNGINRLVVLLDEGSDTYDMQLWRIGQRGLSTTKVWEGDGLYAEDLARIFTDKTGFYTSFARPGAKARFNKPNTVTVVTVMSGTGGSGGLFKVVGYDENGREYEYGLFAMRSIAEEKAKQIARYKDWSFNASRPGAKAAFSVLHLKNLIEPLRRADAAKNTREMNTLLRRVIAVCKAGEIEFPHAAHFYESAREWAQESLDLLQSDGAASLGRGNAAQNLDNAVGRIMSVGKRFQDYSRPGAKAMMGKREAVEDVANAMAIGSRKLQGMMQDAQSGQLQLVKRNLGWLRGFADGVEERINKFESTGFSRPGAKARFYTSPTKTGKNGPVTWDNLFVGHLGNGWTLANKGHEVSGDYERVAHIAYGGEVTFAPGFNQARLDPRVKAYIQKLSVEAAQKKSAGEPLARTGSGQGLYSRPGAKAMMSLLVPELENLYSALQNPNQIITDKRAVKKDLATLKKIDDAYRTGDDATAANAWRTLSAGSRVTEMGQKFKQRMEWVGFKFYRANTKSNGLTLAQRIAVAHDAKRMALR